MIYKHIARNDHLAKSKVTGQSVRALCGKVWVPKPQTPEQLAKRTLCPHCAATFQLVFDTQPPENFGAPETTIFTLTHVETIDTTEWPELPEEAPK